MPQDRLSEIYSGEKETRGELTAPCNYLKGRGSEAGGGGVLS